MIGILGSGFGLYGYLPALVEARGESILLPTRYRVPFFNRVELRRFASSVRWGGSDISVVDSVAVLVLALEPSRQMELIPRCIASSNIERLLLEKPLAPSPAVAIELFESLLHSQKAFRIGYTFRYTGWGQQLLDLLGSQCHSGSLLIRWNFMAHHFRHSLRTWKSLESAGGGAVRFYGIHIIALLAEIGYRNVKLSRTLGASQNEPEQWMAVFEGANLPMCEVIVNTKSNMHEFKVEYSPSLNPRFAPYVLTDLMDPFDSNNDVPTSNQSDRRLSVLVKLCQALWSPTAHEYSWYRASLDLWADAEKNNQFEHSR